jgi:hypothetical protein
MAWTDSQAKDRKKTLDELAKIESQALARIGEELSSVHDSLAGAGKLDGLPDAVKGPIGADVKAALEDWNALKALEARVAAQLKRAVASLK